jgi:hypothetical protein
MQGRFRNSQMNQETLFLSLPTHHSTYTCTDKEVPCFSPRTERSHMCDDVAHWLITYPLGTLGQCESKANMRAFAKRFVRVSFRMSRSHDKGTCTMTMTINQARGEMSHPARFKAEMCKFWGTKMRYVKQTPDCIKAIPILTIKAPCGPSDR